MLRVPAPALSRRALLTGVAAGLLPTWAEAGAGPAPRRPLPKGPIKGMTVSCPRAGQIWGTATMASTLATLRELGVTWTAVHPYAGVRTNGQVRFTPAARTGFLPRCVQIAQRAGQHMFWKPHLAYWGSFEWRGAIRFTDEAAWDRFFAGYRAFIVDQARFAEQAGLPLFAVGTEYKATIHREAAWREIISAVREVYSGQLTYAANWDEVFRVPFWDALDIIGVQAYFPLTDDVDAKTEALVKAWDDPMGRLTALSKKHRRALLFTEVGYPRAMTAAKAPWKPDTDGSARAIDLRSRLMHAALTRIAAEPRVRGAFWWKWIPGRAPWDADFSMKDPEALAAIRRHWR